MVCEERQNRQKACIIARGTDVLDRADPLPPLWMSRHHLVDQPGLRLGQGGGTGTPLRDDRAEPLPKVLFLRAERWTPSLTREPVVSIGEGLGTQKVRLERERATALGFWAVIPWG